MGFIMLVSSALSQEDDWGKFVWNAGGALLNFDAAVLQKEGEFAGAVGGAALGLGSQAINALTGKSEGPDSSATNNIADSDSTIGLGSGSDTTFKPQVGGPTLDSLTLPLSVGSTSDDIVLPGADGSASGDTTGLRTGTENNVGETKDLLNVPNPDTPTPLSDPTQESPTPSPGTIPDSPSNQIDDSTPTFHLSVTNGQNPPTNPPNPSLDDDCDSTNSEASPHAIPQSAQKML